LAFASESKKVTWHPVVSADCRERCPVLPFLLSPGFSELRACDRGATDGARPGLMLGNLASFYSSKAAKCVDSDVVPCVLECSGLDPLCLKE